MMTKMDDTMVIRELLERYFEGEASQGEEKIVREYFTSSENIPHDLEYARAMFGYFRDAAQGRSLKPFKTPRIHRSRRIWGWISTAAAAIAITITITLTGSRSDDNPIYCYVNGEPITDYDLACAYTQGALGLIEGNLHRPGECLVSLADSEKQLKTLQRLGLLLFNTEEQSN